jgi:hypothetical protein
MAGGVQRLRGGSGFRGMWGNSGGGYSEPRISSEDLKKNVQRVLEKHPSGVMGRDLRRLYKEVNSKELPVEDFGVQRPIELVEKELSDTVYYTRCESGHPARFPSCPPPRSLHFVSPLPPSVAGDAAPSNQPSLPSFPWK